MTLWFGLALMTVAAIWAVLWPLARRALSGDTGKLRRLDDLLKGLGLEG